MTDFGQIHYLKISLNSNMYTHTSLTVSSIIISGWVGAVAERKSRGPLGKIWVQTAKLKNRKILWINFRECLPGSDFVGYKLS